MNHETLCGNCGRPTVRCLVDGRGQSVAFQCFQCLGKLPMAIEEKPTMKAPYFHPFQLGALAGIVIGFCATYWGIK